MGMRLFSRLVVGYFAILVLVTVGSVFGIVQLERLNDLTHSLQSIENRIVNYGKDLTDAMLAQVRFEKKYVITRDQGLIEQFRLLERHFQKLLLEARAIDLPIELQARLKQIEDRHRDYLRLFNDEQVFVQEGRPYDEQSYQRKKEAVADSILLELRAINTSSREDIGAKFAQLEVIGARATRVAIIVTGISLVLGIVLALVITRSITRPVRRLEEKTRQIARGNFAGDLEVRSPPEMAELARAFNYMGNRLNELDELKSDFFSTMSHELRTPLTSIKEGIGLLLDDSERQITDKQKKVLRILAEESNRLIGLLNSMLDIAKMEAGMMTYHCQSTQLANLVRQVMMEVEPLAEAKHLALRSELPPDLPLLQLDQERMLQVLRNLVGNALKFTSVGSVHVAARSTGNVVELSVADTGPGISPEYLLTVFDKFQQGEHHASRSGGTGLGLAIVLQIISSHGGKIWVESEPGQGSTFTFTLPI